MCTFHVGGIASVRWTAEHVHSVLLLSPLVLLVGVVWWLLLLLCGRRVLLVWQCGWSGVVVMLVCACLGLDRRVCCVRVGCCGCVCVVGLMWRVCDGVATIVVVVVAVDVFVLVVVWCVGDCGCCVWLFALSVIDVVVVV